MKHPALWLLVLLASPFVRGAEFEGWVLLQRAEPPGRPQDIVYRVKGDKKRVEVTRQLVNTYTTDTTKQEVIVTLDDDMGYVVLPLLAPLTDPPSLEKENESTKLLGYAVQKYVVNSDEGRTELWLAEGFGKYTGFGEGYQQPPVHVPNVDIPEPAAPRPWEWALMGQPLFPLRVITRDENGRVIFWLEAKTITPQPLDGRLFTPSPTYKKFDRWPDSRP